MIAENAESTKPYFLKGELYQTDATELHLGLTDILKFLKTMRLDGIL